MSDRHLARLVIASTAGAAAALIADIAVLRIGLLPWLLVIPGLALSLHLGPMAGSARLLVSVACSCAVLAVVAGAPLLLGLYAPEVTFLVLAAGAGTTAGVVLGRPVTAGDRDATDRRDRLESA